MSRSATSSRQAATQLRISRAALRLADEHGLDGFTMEDLAGASDVSRRTLFNYFPSKIDAVLGPPAELPEEAMRAFRDGGPHGDLVLDLSTLVHCLFDHEIDRAELIRLRSVMREPRILAAVHERFLQLTERLVDDIAVREGPDFDTGRARIAVRVLASLFQTALDTYLDDPAQPTLAEAFDHTLQHARDLLARPQES